jgi:hypothetical protein
MKKYPLRRWMDLNEMTSGDLEKTSGVNASTIRHICRGCPASAEKYKTISRFTGIPTDVLISPEEYPDFDVTGCKAVSMTALSAKCAGL